LLSFNVSSYTGPLQTICSNKQIFRWTPLHQKCFDEIKHLMCRAPILKPIQWNPPENLLKEERNKLHIWVITDACPVEREGPYDRTSGRRMGS
jgi:hypothetical protein